MVMLLGSSPVQLRVSVLQLACQVLPMIGLPAGEHGDVLEHGLAAITEARSLDGGRPSATPRSSIDHEGGEGFAVDVLGHESRAGLRPASATFPRIGMRSFIGTRSSSRE